MSEQPAYPTGDLAEYGCRAALYEEGGFVVFGQGRRALAAANHIARHEDGIGWRKALRGRPAPTIRQLWASFHEDCGCTPEEHANHEGECWDHDCEHPQLPPCGDEYSWMCSTSEVERPGLLPVVEVRW